MSGLAKQEYVEKNTLLALRTEASAALSNERIRDPILTNNDCLLSGRLRGVQGNFCDTCEDECLHDLDCFDDKAAPRDCRYRPELMLGVHAHLQLLGMIARLLGLRRT